MSDEAAPTYSHLPNFLSLITRVESSCVQVLSEVDDTPQISYTVHGVICA